MNLKSRSTKIIVAVGVLVLATAAYFLLMNKDDGETVLIEDGSAASEAQSVFINLAAQIEPVSFDTSILSDPRFLGLQDIHTAIVPEPVGRTDPFAPLSRTPGNPR